MEQHERMAIKTNLDAVHDTLWKAMEEDERVVIMGEDVGYFGGVFRATAHLQEKHGKNRVFDTPISECGIIGAAVGMGALGRLPEAEYMPLTCPEWDSSLPTKSNSQRGD